MLKFWTEKTVTSLWLAHSSDHLSDEKIKHRHAILLSFDFIAEIYHFSIFIVTGNLLYFYATESAPQSLSSWIILISPTSTEHNSIGINEPEERKLIFSATSAKQKTKKRGRLHYTSISFPLMAALCKVVQRGVFKKCRQFPNAQVMVAKPILSPALSPQDGWINSLWSTKNSLGTARGNVKGIHQPENTAHCRLLLQTHTDCVAGMGRQVQVLHKDHGTSENKLFCNCSPPTPAKRPVHFLNGNKSDAWSHGHLGRLLPLLCGLIALTLKRHLQVITVGSPSNHWNLSNSNHYAMY